LRAQACQIDGVNEEMVEIKVCCRPPHPPPPLRPVPDCDAPCAARFARLNSPLFPGTQAAGPSAYVAKPADEMQRFFDEVQPQRCLARACGCVCE
jgi:hypothetical protein